MNDGQTYTHADGYTGKGEKIVLTPVQTLVRDIRQQSKAGAPEGALWGLLKALAEAQHAAQADGEGTMANWGLHALIEHALTGALLTEEQRKEIDECAAWARCENTDWSAYHAAREFLFFPWLPAGELTLMSGTGGGGKSTITFQLGLSLVLKDFGPPMSGSFGGTFKRACLPEPCSVVIAGWEDGHAEMRRRVTAILEGRGMGARGSEIGDRLIALSMKGQGPMWAPREADGHVSSRGGITPTGARILARAEQAQAKLLVIDPSAAAFLGDENNRSLVRAFTSHLSEWAERHGCAIILVAHPPKSATGAGGVSGSTDWHAGVRSVWLYETTPLLDANGKAIRDKIKMREGAPIMTLKHDKSNYAKASEPVEICWHKGGFYELEADDGDEQSGYHTGRHPYEA